MGICVYIHRFDIKTIRVVPGTVNIADTDHFYPLPVDQEGPDRTYIAESLYGHGESVHFFMILFAPGFQCKEKSSSGRFISAERAAGRQRFAGNDPRFPFTRKGGVFISNPCHDLTVCVYIRRRHIFVRSDNRENFTHIAACQTLEFALGQFMGIYLDTAFSAAVRNISDRVLYGHPCGKSFYFILVRSGMEADTAFCRAAGCIVLYPVPRKHFHMAVIHGNRNAHGQFPFRITHKFIVILFVT